jgi:hypothetical protein
MRLLSSQASRKATTRLLFFPGFDNWDHAGGEMPRLSFQGDRGRWWILALLALGVVASCGRKSHSAAERGEFENYFQRFETYSLQQGRSIKGDDRVTIHFGTLKKGVLGICDHDEVDITIDTGSWQHLTETRRELLLLHELGHCLLGRLHRDEQIEMAVPNTGRTSRIPASVMNTYNISATLFHELQNYYLKELFGHA